LAKRPNRPHAAAARQRLVVATTLALGVAVGSAFTVLLIDGEAAPPAPDPARQVTEMPAAEPLPGPPPAPETATVAVPQATPTIVDPAVPAWRRHAVQVAARDDWPMVALVIDDMGLDRQRSAQVIALPGPLTLSYLTYADDLPAQTAAGRAAGHELMLHVPMAPRDIGFDPGPNVLEPGLADAELARRLDWGLGRFAGYVGINNHMGSRFTADRAAMARVMAALDARGLLFLDSRTTGDSVGLSAAAAQGVPAVARDVFLDHERTPDAVAAALVELEDTARRRGYAIAIGHPADVTIEALTAWLPDARRRGLMIVPLSAVVDRVTRAGGAG